MTRYRRLKYANDTRALEKAAKQVKQEDKCGMMHKEENSEKNKHK